MLSAVLIMVFFSGCGSGKKTDLYTSEQQLIDAMVRLPKLIERPIVVNGSRAALGRPPEAVLDIL